MNTGLKRTCLVVGVGSVLLTLAACAGAEKVKTGALVLRSHAGDVVDAVRPLAVLDAASVVLTKKTSFDHVAQWITGEDCSFLRADAGGHYCQPWYENRPIVAQLYCYRTLADTSCYETPSPHSGDKLIGIREGGRLPTY